MKTAVDRTSLPRWLPPIVFLLALAAALWRIPTPGAVAFQPPPLNAPQIARETARALPQIPGLPGRPDETTLTRWPDGRQALAWIAASRDAVDEPAVWLSVQDRQGRWATPLEIASRATTAGGSFAFVKRIGSPVLYAEGSWLHLWYIGHALGNWGAAALYHSASTDGGKTWTLVRRLPFAAGGNLGRYTLRPPLPLADGGLALPLADGEGRPLRWLRFDATGRLIDLVDIGGDDPLFTGQSARPLEIPR